MKLTAFAARLFFSAIFFFACATVRGEVRTNSYGLRVVTDIRDYMAQVKESPDLAMVDARKVIPSIKVDLKYAGTHNLLGKKLYTWARPLVRKQVAERLRRVQEDLSKEGLGLKIYDAYRPYNITVELWRGKALKPEYLAPPRLGSHHNRGAAVDVTLVDAQGQELDMPSHFDDLSERASHNFKNASPSALANRRKLGTTMCRHGFVGLSNEWWHYRTEDAEKFDILDIPFMEF